LVPGTYLIFSLLSYAVYSVPVTVTGVLLVIKMPPSIYERPPPDVLIDVKSTSVVELGGHGTPRYVVGGASSCHLSLPVTLIYWYAQYAIPVCRTGMLSMLY
jgi:hypothetical protein